MTGEPDPKERQRIVDRQAARTAALKLLSCAACGGIGANQHHVVQRGSPYFGDDVPANFVSLCGSGTMGCHGALHGSPYWVSVGGLTPERRDADWVRRRVGEHIRRRRPDTIAYVLERLGAAAGRAYLRRNYLLDLG